MSSIPTLPGIISKMIDTPRLKMHALFSSADDAIPVVFIHGNASSATYWEEIMLKLPPAFRGIAPDLRGYGDTEDKLIDATRAYGEWVDDVFALTDALGLERFHVVGHSLGGAIVLSLIAANSARILSATLVAPGSPYGFGGTKDVYGTPCYADFAGSGGGMVEPEFARLLGDKNRGSDNPQASPRNVMNAFYWKPPFKPAREEDLLSSMLSEKVGADKYPGDSVQSPNWPYVAPGKWGPINAASPKYVGDSVERLIAANPKPPILWVRGDSDQIVSDNSFFDVGTLGKLGHWPGWPGDDIYPPQPMVSQTRGVLDRYKANEGAYTERVIADTGHTPYVEKPEAFVDLLVEHIWNGKFQGDPVMTHAIAARLEEIQKRVAVTSREVAQLLNVSPETASRWRTGKTEPQPDRRDYLLKLEWLSSKLSDLYSPDEARLWLFSSHGLLKGDRPIDRIQEGAMEDVLTLISQIKDGAFV